MPVSLVYICATNAGFYIMFPKWIEIPPESDFSENLWLQWTMMIYFSKP